MDIAGHLVSFGVFGWLLGRSMGVLGVGRATLVTILFASLYGAVLELGQIPIPGRGFQVLDLVTNTFGAALGAWLQAGLGRKRVGGNRPA
jgi:VanZ family protein